MSDSFECMSDSFECIYKARKYRALLGACGALLGVNRFLLSVYRALLGVCSSLLSVHRALLEVSGSCDCK